MPRKREVSSCLGLGRSWQEGTKGTQTHTRGPWAQSSLSQPTVTFAICPVPSYYVQQGVAEEVTEEEPQRQRQSVAFLFQGESESGGHGLVTLPSSHLLCPSVSPSAQPGDCTALMLENLWLKHRASLRYSRPAARKGGKARDK